MRIRYYNALFAIIIEQMGRRHKDAEELDRTANQWDLTENSRTHHPTAVEYIFSKTQGLFCRIDHILDIKQPQET